MDFKPAVQVTYGSIILLYAPIQDGTVEHFCTVHQWSTEEPKGLQQIMHPHLPLQDINLLHEDKCWNKSNDIVNEQHQSPYLIIYDKKKVFMAATISSF